MSGEHDSPAPTAPAKADPAPKTVASSKPRRHPWLRKILISLGIAIVVLIVGVQIVLSSSLPKTIILGALEKALGLKAEAASISTGWWGHTTVSDVKLTIPLDDGPFLETKQIRVKHTSLLMMLFVGLEIEDLQVDQPIVHLRQSASGRWNVSDLLGGIGHGGGGAAAAESGGGGGRAKFPAIDIHGAAVQVTERSGKTSQIGPLDLLGQPDESAPDLLWKYTFDLPKQITLSGRVVTGGDWRNEAKIEVKDLKPLAAPFVGSELPDVKLIARWQGRADQGIQGRITIDSLAVNAVTARGLVAVSVADGNISVSPENLEIWNETPSTQPPTLVASGGKIKYENGSIRSDKLTLRAGGGFASVDGQFSPELHSGDITARWTGMALPTAVTHEGELAAKLSQNLSGQVELAGHIDTRGHLAKYPNRGWAGRIDIGGGGPALDDLAIHLSVPQFTLSSDRGGVPLDGLGVQLAFSRKLGGNPGGVEQRSNPGLGLSLEWAKIGDTDRVAANGFFLLATKEWALNFHGSHWPLPEVDSEGLAIVLEVAGDPKAVNIHKLKIAGVESVVTVTGSYNEQRRKPVDVKVVLEHIPPQTSVEATAIGARKPQSKVVWGALAGTGSVEGTLDPMNLRLKGDLQGLGLKLWDHNVGDITVKVAGEADDHHAHIYRDPSGPPIEILGGQWEMEVVHSLDQAATVLTVAMHQLPLTRFGELFGQKGLEGTAEGSWTIFIPEFEDVERQVVVAGGLSAKTVAVNGLKIDSVDVKTSVQKGIMRVDELTVRSGDGKFTGKAAIALADPKSIELTDLRLDAWPVELPPMTYVTANASAPRVAVMFPDAAATDPNERKLRLDTGPIVLTADVRVGDVDAGVVRLNANVDGRVVHIPLLGAQLLGSTTEARATIDLDQPNKTTATLAMHNIDPRQLQKLVPPLRALSGTFDLDGVLAPSQNPFALEPLAADFTLKSKDAYWRQVTLPNQPPNEPAATVPVETAAAVSPSTGATAIATAPTSTPATAPVLTSGIHIGNGRFRAMLQFDERFSVERATLADQSGTVPLPPPGDCRLEPSDALSVNTLQLAGGEVRFWARFVRNENDRNVPGFTTISSQARVAFHCLDLNEIVQSFKPDRLMTPGMLDGDVVLYGTTRNLQNANGQPLLGTATTQPSDAADDLVTRALKSMQGEGTFSLTKSDIVNIHAVKTLYGALHLGQDLKAPVGKGQASFRIENSDLFLTAFRYYNQGVEIRAVGEVDEIYRLANAPIHMTGYGSIRTLKDIKLPIVRSLVPDIDSILSAIQSNGVSVRVFGTLIKPQDEIVLFSELGKSMRELLVGDYVHSNKTPPPQ